MPNGESIKEKKPTERVVEYVTEKAKGINWMNIILPVGAVFLGYEFLKSQGIIAPKIPTSTQATPECPRGPTYNRGFFQDCDPGYAMDLWSLTGACNCTAKTATLRNSMQQSNYDQFPTNDWSQLSLEKWHPMSKEEKLKLGIVSK